MHNRLIPHIILLVVITFFCFPIHISGGDNSVLYFVPGLGSKDGQYEVECNRLKNIFSASNCKKITWEADGTENADKFAKTFAEQISNLSKEEQERLILIGHSLGGRCVVKTLAILHKKNIKIDRAIFLAAAIPNNDPDIIEAIQATKRNCINVFCNNDRILNEFFINGNAKALGQYGLDETLKCKKTSERLDALEFYQEYKYASHQAIRYIEFLQKVL